MARNVMRRNLRRSIQKSLGRYVAILGIIALGAGIFVGLKVTKRDMVATGQVFMDDQNMFDLRLISTYGWSLDQAEEIAKLEGVKDAEGLLSLDVIGTLPANDSESVYKLYALPESVNQVYLLGGRMPEGPDECLFDGFFATDSILGTTVTVSQTNSQETLDSLTEHTFTVVGYVSSPLYMDMTRGSTTLGNGSVSAFIYIPREAFSMDYYTEIHVTVEGDYAVYTDAYNDAMADAGDRLKPLLEPLTKTRYETVLADAWDDYYEGVAEYEDGYAEYLSAKEDALRELSDARIQLEEAQLEADENRKTLEDALTLLQEGQAQIDANSKKLTNAEYELKKTKQQTYEQLDEAQIQLLENYRQIIEGQAPLEEGISQIKDGLSQLDDGISQLESGLSQLDTAISLYEGLASLLQPSIDAAKAALDLANSSPLGSLSVPYLESQLNNLLAQQKKYQDEADSYKADRDTYSQQLSQLKAQRAELAAQLQTLEQTRQEMTDGLNAINDGLAQLDEQRALADEQFLAAEEEIRSGKNQLKTAQAELDENLKTLNEGFAALQEGEAELQTAWEEFYSGEQEALAEFEKAEAELADAKTQLDDAYLSISELAQPDVYVLDRNTNPGYLALNSNSDIVEGVSAVFPAFFLLIAALVCITTMTRMVSEERTQIGTMKALGYSNWGIIGKYLAYAGSAAILGCGVGVLVGSVAFPLILWEVYGLILLVQPNLVLQIDWPLCIAVVAAYTAVTLLVTWYCCRMALREVPAELIRPKAPTSGKKIFLEYLPFWHRVSFLDKVTWRNIFRYHQRLLMMLVGIGGCTALLVTGFGIRDSIMDIVTVQFEEVTLFDLDVHFSGELTQEDMDNFCDELALSSGQVAFFHQSSADLTYEDQTESITLIASDGGFSKFMDFHKGKESLAYPGNGEALVSVGVAQRLGVQTGDVIRLRDSQMRVLELEVTGIFDNHVYNYVVVNTETVERQWQETPPVQMACVTAREGQDPSDLGVLASEFPGVMSVTVCDVIAQSVGSMLEALDLVVVTVVFCAGLLAMIVLYNLTNINITERVREIATIKVLGFRAGESAMYVFKENLILSAMGVIVGLPLGRLLLAFVMTKIQVSMVWFRGNVLPMSYFWAAVLTMLSACIVDFLLYFKLEKINMAEALKSVE